MEDLISRKSAIEALGEEPIVWNDDADYELGQRSQWKADKLAIESVPPERSELNEWCTDCKEYDQERHCCPRFNRVIRETLDEVKPQWIPCSERLPEKPFGCLVTVWDTEPMTGEEFENLLPYFVGWDGEQWNDADGEQCPFEVTAWMPLPEPWDDGSNYDREFWGDEK